MWRVAWSTLIATMLTLVSGLAPAMAQDHLPEPGYLDDGSTPEAVVQSFYDAINKREYARAYSYWEPGAAERELPPFDEFVQGYGDTTSVEVTLGTVSSDVGAGQLYFLVPVSLVGSLSDGSVQMFTGCYRLHLARPQLQAVPPFRPMGVQHANIVQVDDEAQPSAAYCQ